MVSANFLTLLLATAASAVPLLSEKGLNSTVPDLTTRGLNATERSLNTTKRSLNATVPGLSTRGLNRTVPHLTTRGLNATVPHLITRGMNSTVPHLTTRGPNATERSLNATVPDLTTRGLNTTKRSLNATKRSLNATERSLNATKRNSDRRLAHGEVLLFGKDNAEVIQLDKWHKLVGSKGYLPEPPAWNQSWIDDAKDLAPIPYNESIHGPGPEKHDCAHTFSIVTDKKERFVNWDVQMSPVVIGYGKGIDVTVSKSYSVADTVTVSTGLDLQVIKERLGASLGFSVARTWTTLQGYMIRGTVEDGETGVVISTPWTTRYYGRARQGCVGSMRQTGTWTADVYEEGSYEGVDWVAGAITVCAKKQESIPLSRCHGSGDFK